MDEGQTKINDIQIKEMIQKFEDSGKTSDSSLDQERIKVDNHPGKYGGKG